MTRRERKQSESRRRTGCWTCKEKHIQCTEEWPVCSRCERLGVRCVRGLKLLWREDAAQRGIHFGREGTWSKRPTTKPRTKIGIDHEFDPVPLDQYIGRWLFLNTTYWDFGESDGEEIPKCSLEQLEEIAQSVNGVVRSSPCRPLGHPLVHYCPVESFLLDYFIRGIAPFCSLSTECNPYLSLVTPLALNYQQPHKPLRNTLLAIAANQLQLLGNHTYEREAFVFKQKALHGLQNEINNRKPSAGTVATVLMLCFHDITDGCTPSWTTHLRGGLRLMAMLPHQMCESEALKKFFVMYFVAHDIMGRTGAEDSSEMGQEDHSWLEDDDLEEIDVLMGCSRGLMTLINKISALASKKSKVMKTRRLSPQEVSTFNAARNAIEDELRVLHQKLPSYAPFQADLLRIAETKRLAAILYLRERLGSPAGLCYFYPLEKFSRHHKHDPEHRYNNTGNPSLGNQVTTSGAVETSPSGFKARIISMIISLIDTLPDSPTLLWPLFIVGNVGLDDEQHRRFVLDRLTSIQKTRNLGSVRRARMVVENAYRAKDIDFPRGKVWGDNEPGVISLA
ncbi:conserved hypothetical protein [Histoplasma capsulatum G186AR]|uniref:Zn(2)-C6 fungal-type domain-containing protein n=2 Tax=Ajellomyces capsulatus TaxID=5037 RepID=C0NXV7_AJECG|nr:uncharacterized protein HCBG_07751 [Histoplasma capsulatum G186AR]EEH03625.1 conserved hypothetical protein [Histoplasma capsulatum G186AR]KAG5293801.1 putative Zn(II)2Cys6 transcription factor [Histoplasma capsulatum]QSS75253.1 putative Zn(II)2Cys6 transcription factor [Histoplasma capsulatum G186AR]